MKLKQQKRANVIAGSSRLSALLGVLTACAPAQGPVVPPEEPSMEASPDPSRWRGSTESPLPGSTQDPLLRSLVELCAREDGGLSRVATRLAEHQATDYVLLETDETNFELRMAGVPNVWPHAWAIVGDPSTHEAKTAMKTWLDSFNEGGERRCGLGKARSLDGKTVIAALAVDAVADLSPFPQKARLGQWLRLEARLLAPASAVEVILLGPQGPPRTVPATLHQGVVKANFAVDQPGQWKIQVLPTFQDGPRPALESLVFVDAPYPKQYNEAPAPGELPSEQATDAQALLLMLNQARRSEQLPELRFSKELEAAAQIQANAMAEKQHLAHDVGLGTPTDRLVAVGLGPSLAGENVAHAKNVIRAHRALWSSPSHRSNTLHPEFTHAGVGVAVGVDGSLWVCIVFAGLPHG